MQRGTYSRNGTDAIQFLFSSCARVLKQTLQYPSKASKVIKWSANTFSYTGAKTLLGYCCSLRLPEDTECKDTACLYFLDKHCGAKE